MRHFVLKTIALLLVIFHSAYGADLTYVTTKIIAPKGEVLAEIADTRMKQTKGLGGSRTCPKVKECSLFIKLPITILYG